MTLKAWLATQSPETLAVLKPLLDPPPLIPGAVADRYSNPLAPDEEPDDLTWDAGVRDDY